jgi:hypothetical protein
MTSLIRYGLLALVLSAVGCGSDDSKDGPTGGPDARPTADAPPAAMIGVSVGPLDPGGIKADGDPFHGMNIIVTATNFALVNPFAGDARIANAAGQGGYALFLDASTTALVTDYRPNIQLTVAPDTATGAHTMRIQALQNDGTPVSPAVTGTSMTFTIMP